MDIQLGVLRLPVYGSDADAGGVWCESSLVEVEVVALLLLVVVVVIVAVVKVVIEVVIVEVVVD